MLKKAGIVVAGSAAALLALSPLAFAGDMGYGPDGHHHHRHSHSQGNDRDTDVNYASQGNNQNNGLLGIGNVNALNNLNVCPSVTAGLSIGDVLGILSPGRGGDANGGDAACVIDNGFSQTNR